MNKLFTVLLALPLLFVNKINAQSQCSCWQQRDSSFSYVPMSQSTGKPYYSNDDGSSSSIDLPFTFCFWGTNYDSVYINNNGNLTFGATFGTYTPTRFPSSAVPSMIAPFWGDVDTQGPTVPGSNVVIYKVEPHYMIVQWDSVGYFSANTDRLNSFQVIISDGTDPIIPKGNNVEFCYKQMQWTAGDVSGGTDGIDGQPATVGANEGDGVRSIQIGLFDTANSNYYGQYPPPGPGGSSYDGVYWLDNKSFLFNLCSGSIGPLVSGVSPCDTFKVCMGDTTVISIQYLAPVQGDSVWSKLALPNVPGVSIVANYPGPTDSMHIRVIGSSSNLGYHTVNVYGYDNSHPQDTTYTSFVVDVLGQKPTITGMAYECRGIKDTLVASGAKTYLWDNGSTSATYYTGPINADSIFIVTGYTDGCMDTAHYKVGVKVAPTVSIPNPVACENASVVLTASPSGPGPFTYTWSPGGNTTDTIRVIDTVSTYSVTVSNGCLGSTKTITIHPDNPTLSACCNKTIAYGDDTVITVSGTNVTGYQWQPSNSLNHDTGSVVIASPTVTTTYTVTGVGVGGCDTTVFITIKVSETPCTNFTVPNVFTPNYKGNSGLDNVLYINPQNVDGWSITVYDRWGKEVFTSTSVTNYWTGLTESGAEASDGVYYYIITATCQNTTYKKEGFIQLIR